MAKAYISILKAYQEQIMRNFGVKSLKLFGSVARNQDTPDSDVDICVEMEPDMFKRYALKDYLEKLFSRPVDVVRLHKNMNPLLRSEIEKDGISVF